MGENPLHKMMKPGSISTVGAGNNPMKMGTMHALSILHDGYKGKFYPIHPTDSTVLGHKAYKHVIELPEAPDLALLAVPSEHILGLIDDFGKIGTKRIIIITAGFRETGEEGKEKENQLRVIAEKHGIRIIGPNCMGIINTEISLNTTVGMCTMKPGMLGFASQSGTYVAQTLAYLQKRGIRFSKAISVGNSVNISINDALEYLGEDEQTRAISLYIEGISDIQGFLKIARKVTRRKPVLAQYVGGSEAGARSGLSHTGSMAAPEHLYRGLFRQAGIIWVDSIEELYINGWALATQPLLRGNRVGVITNSGGPGSAIANQCEKGGLKVPEFSEGLREKLRPLVPPHAPCGNPVDITFSMDMNVLARDIPEMVMKSGEVDAVVLHGAMRSGFIGFIYPHLKELLNNAPLETILDMMKVDFNGSVSLTGEQGIPMLISSFFDRDDDYTAAYHEGNVPVFDSPEKTSRCMNIMLQYMKIRERRVTEEEPLPGKNEEADAIIKKALKMGAHSLDEYTSKRLLSCYGIPVSKDILAENPDRAVEASDEIGYPVVLKACSGEILHKTGKGLMELNVSTPEDVRKSFARITESAGTRVPVIVSGMIRGEREFMAGLTRYPGFGPAVMFGLGGVLTEALNDTVFRCAPVTREDSEEMLHEIRAKSLTGEYRGMPAINIESVSSILQGLGIISVLHPEIKEIDMNPVIVNGGEPVAVDALVIIGAT